MSYFSRRSVLGAFAAPVAAAVLTGAARAQGDYPTRPVRWIVGFAAGGGNDVIARIVADKMGASLGQSIVIENRGGAGGTIGEEAVAKSAPDGYTILHDATAFSVNGSLYSSLAFDYRKDFDPVFLVALVPNILVVTPSVPANTLADVMAGQVKFFFANGSSAVGLIKGGKVKAIAHTGKGRLASLPDIPPMSDTLPGFEGYDWNGVFVPHGTPEPIVKKLNTALNAAIVAPQVTARFAELNIESRQNSPQEFRAYVEDQMALWSRVVKEANIKLG